MPISEKTRDWGERKPGYCKSCGHLFQYCSCPRIEVYWPISVKDAEITPVKCPACFKKLLYWIESLKHYECINSKCGAVYTDEQYNKANALIEPKTPGKAWFGNEYFDAKKKKWRRA